MLIPLLYGRSIGTTCLIWRAQWSAPTEPPFTPLLQWDGCWQADWRARRGSPGTAESWFGSGFYGPALSKPGRDQDKSKGVCISPFILRPFSHPFFFFWLQSWLSSINIHGYMRVRHKTLFKCDIKIGFSKKEKRKRKILAKPRIHGEHVTKLYCNSRPRNTTPTTKWKPQWSIKSFI